MNTIGADCLLHYLCQNSKEKLKTVVGSIHVRRMYVTAAALYQLIHRQSCFTNTCKTFEAKPWNCKRTVLKQKHKFHKTKSQIITEVNISQSLQLQLIFLFMIKYWFDNLLCKVRAEF